MDCSKDNISSETRQEERQTPFGFALCRLVEHLSKSKLRQAIRLHFGSELPDNIKIENYTLWEHIETGLIFSDPLIPGSDEYYNWLASQIGYYPRTRWEYDSILDTALSMVQPASIVDIGCGDGKFLKLINSRLQEAKIVGVDTSAVAIESCRRSGIDCYQGELNDLLALGKLKPAAYDLVTSFHCLEHVPNPLEFMQGLAQLCKIDGLIAVSTPLSPMPHELAWFDVQNSPPHHLTKWCCRSYRHLAEKLGRKVEFRFHPKKLTAYGAWRSATKLKIWGTKYNPTALERILGVITRPTSNLRLLRDYRTYWTTSPEGLGSCDVLAIFK